MLTSAILVAVIMFLVKTADHTLGQPLIERPLICGALVGLVLGDLQQGIIIGATLELIFLGTITIGGSVPADLAVGSVLATAFTILTTPNRRWPLRWRCRSACWRCLFIRC